MDRTASTSADDVHRPVTTPWTVHPHESVLDAMLNNIRTAAAHRERGQAWALGVALRAGGQLRHEVCLDLRPNLPHLRRTPGEHACTSGRVRLSERWSSRLTVFSMSCSVMARQHDHDQERAQLIAGFESARAACLCSPQQIQPGRAGRLPGGRTPASGAPRGRACWHASPAVRGGPLPGASSLLL